MKKLILTLVGLGILGASLANADFRRDRDAEKQVNKAVELLNKALPIYDGKRADADNLCRLARREIFEASHPASRDIDRYAPLRDNDTARNYGPSQVRESQRRLHGALKHIDAALGDLRRSDGSYDETSEAVRDLRKAGELTRHCLNEYAR